MGQSAQMSLAVIFNDFPPRVLSHKPIWALDLLPFTVHSRRLCAGVCFHSCLYTPHHFSVNLCVHKRARLAWFLSPIRHELAEQIDTAVGFFFGDL